MTFVVLCILLFYMASVGFVEGCKNRWPSLAPISDSRYHEARTMATLAVFVLFCLAAHAFWWPLAALISGNALYNRCLVKISQGSWIDINRNQDGTPATFAIFGKQFPYPWGMTGKPELFFTFPFFGAAGIILSVMA
jgi:hypothetical protein